MPTGSRSSVQDIRQVTKQDYKTRTLTQILILLDIYVNDKRVHVSFTKY